METLKAVIAILMVFVALPVLILWLNDKISGRSPSKKELDKDSDQFRKRLVNPDVVAAERHFGCSLPASLRVLYENTSELLREDFDIENPRKGDDEPDHWYVGFYCPLDEQAFREVWPDCKGALVFADDGCGNSYLIDPHLSDPEVRFYDHEGGEFHSTGLTLSQFLSAPRQSSFPG